MEIVYKNVSDLIPYDNNPRNNDAAVEYVKNSIREFGFKVPIVIDRDDVIVAGHTRLRASKELGLHEVPCIVADDLTDDQLKAFRVADNKTSEFASWDFDKLEKEIANIDMDMWQFGFDLSFDFEPSEVEDENSEIEYFKSEDIQKMVVDNWKEISLEDFVSTIIDEPTAMWQFNRLCNGYNDGYNISLLFNPHRLDTETANSKSIFYGYNKDKKYREQYARYMVNVSSKVVQQPQYYKYLSIGTAGYQYVNEFPPYHARDIYKTYCKDGDRILNPCAGWGGRLLGVVSSGLKDIEYVETEPQKLTYKGLKQMKEWLHAGDNIKQYDIPFEELPVKEDYFDFVFTSPPYFNTEVYSNEETQSYKNKSSYEQWRDEWYIPFIDKILFCMKKGGKALLNVGNVRYPMEKDLKKHLAAKGIKCRNVYDFKIGGSGVGARTGEDGEPFVLFEK